MKFKIKRKWLLIICLGLFLWVAGIVITPLLASCKIPLGKKIAFFMYFFYQPVCHQLSERSFWLSGFTYAVCIRCFGFYLGGLILSLIYFFKQTISNWKLTSYTILVTPVIIDFILERINLYTNIDGLRFFTGLLLGIAVFQLLIMSLTAEKIDSPAKSRI
jgi:uncharacterized membrane protein